MERGNIAPGASLVLRSLATTPTSATRFLSAPPTAATASTSTRVVTASASSNKDTSVIIIYTKETCPLCDGLKDKVTAILERAPFTGSALNGFTIQHRDIMSNPEWEQRYSMEIPVLAVVRTDGSEHVVPRQSPRAPVDRLEQAIVEALEQAM